MANTYLTRTPSSAGNRKTWTMSYWVKRSILDSNNIMFQTLVSTYTWCRFDGNQRFQFQDGNGGNKVTTQVFRDTNAWYHFVVAIDTDNSTAGDRYKIYVNGERITAFDTSTDPSLGYEGEWNKAQLINIGRHSSINSYNYNGLMSHYHFIDGTAYDASAFGETDATTGEWKIKTDPSVTYGTNGFFILKDGNSVTDQSGNGNNFTVGGGTLTKTKDCPSNVFATLNALCNGSNTTLSNGNTVTTGNTASDSGMSTTTLPVASSGKYYWEMKIAGSHGDYPKAGIFKNWEAISQGTKNGASGGAFQLDAYIQKGSTTLFSDDGNITITAPANDNIIMYALDSVNGKFYIGNNGAWYNSGDPTSGSTGTGSVLNLTSGNINMIATHEYNGSVSNWNFGNGFFGTTAVATNSGNGYAGAEGKSIFNYQPPTGYSALSTKGLNE